MCDELEVLGCTDGNSPNFNPYATDDDGTCLVGGCTVTAACNFDPEADYLLAGACEFSSCVGCMDVNACNFDPEALVPNLALCTYPAGQFLDCDGNCTVGEDCEGTCGGTVTLDDCGVCGGDNASCSGCTDPAATNYDPSALVEDGTCEFPECLGDLNGDLLVSVADILEMLGDFGCVENCDADLTGDNAVSVEDLLTLLANFGLECPE